MIPSDPKETAHVHFDFGALSARDRYKLLIGTVIPRPIALVTTVDEAGRPNAAPFSFFNVLSAEPALVVLGIEHRPDKRRKDTTHNIRVTEEFTVNIVDDAMAHAMNVCGVPFPPDVDELSQAGLAILPGVHVKCPRIAAAPAALECRRHTTLSIATSRDIVLGEVLGCFVRGGAVDPATKHVDPRKMDVIGRLSGHGYTRTRDTFDMPTLSLADWERLSGS